MLRTPIRKKISPNNCATNCNHRGHRICPACGLVSLGGRLSWGKRKRERTGLLTCARRALTPAEGGAAGAVYGLPARLPGWRWCAAARPATMGRRFCLAAAVAAMVAGWLPAAVQAPSGRAAWDLRTTGRQVVVQGHQAHPGRLPASFHMASVEDTAEECRDTGEVSFSSTDLALVSDRDSHCLAVTDSDADACTGIECVPPSARPPLTHPLVSTE